MAKQLCDILSSLSKNSITDLEIHELINAASRIALNLLNKGSGFSHSNFSSSETSLSDLATDSITPLFIRNKSGELPIRKALLNWDKQIIDEASANYFLYKIISSRIEQETAKKLKEADPFFGKILRSFNHLVDTGRINKVSWFGISYLTPADCIEITQKPITLEELENFPSEYFQGTNEKIISRLFTYLSNETEYFPAIPLNALIRKIKHVNASFLNQEQSEVSNEFFEDRLDIQLIVNNSLTSINQRIDDFYSKKGKFNSTETEIVKKVVREFSIDIQDGGISRGLFDYLIPHLPELTKEHFYAQYHQPLDYLLRLLKKEIAVRLEEQNN